MTVRLPHCGRKALLLGRGHVGDRWLILGAVDLSVLAVLAVLAVHSGLGVRLIRRIMFEPGGERLAIACRATDMAPKIFAAIYRLLRTASAHNAPVNEQSSPSPAFHVNYEI